MAKESPMQKALKDLRDQGYIAEVTEKRLPIPGKNVTKDLFGCIDLMGMKIGVPLLAVQATSWSHVTDRTKKAKQRAQWFVTTGNRFEVWGYGPLGKRVVAMIAGQWVVQSKEGGRRVA